MTFKFGKGKMRITLILTTNEDSCFHRETINQVVCSNQAKGEVSKNLKK